MYELKLDEAEKWVRAKMDELNENESTMADIDDIDSNEFKQLVARFLPEAINYVHGNAPLQILDGETLTTAEAGTTSVDVELVLTFGINKDLLRLIALSITDGPLVTMAYPEDSSVGRAQMTEYGRGTFDNPRLILKQGRPNSQVKNSFAYYCAQKATDTVTRFEYIPRYSYSATTDKYKVADAVVEEVIERLAGELLTVYKDNLASYYLGTPVAQEA